MALIIFLLACRAAPRLEQSRPLELSDRHIERVCDREMRVVCWTIEGRTFGNSQGVSYGISCLPYEQLPYAGKNVCRVVE